MTQCILSVRAVTTPSSPLTACTGVTGCVQHDGLHVLVTPLSVVGADGHPAGTLGGTKYYKRETTKTMQDDQSCDFDALHARHGH